MTKRSKIIIGVIIAIIVIGGIWYGLTRQPKEEKVIKIGVILPLSSGAAAYGDQIKKGIDLAVEEISDQNIKLIYEDSKCDPKESVSAYNKLVNINGVKIIIGGFCSSVTLSISPLAEKDHVLLITPGSAAKKISEAGDYIFRNHITMVKKTGHLAEFASAKFKKIAIIYNGSNDTFVDGMNMFKDVYNNINGNEIVAIESFKMGDTDFKSRLSKIKFQEPEAIYIGSIMPELALVVKQIKELNIDIQILTDDGVLDPNFLEATKNLNEGIIFGTTLFDRASSSNFWETYYNSFGEDPTIFSAQGYDTLNILYSIIKNKCFDGDSTCIKNELYNLKNYSGVSGNTSFDENGDAVKEVVLKTIKNGEFVIYEE